LYVDKYGLEVVCIRIGSFLERPTDLRHLSTWLSPSDCLQLICCSIDAPDLGFLITYGVSANTRSWWSNDGWDRLGYSPRDDAEAFADKVTPEEGLDPDGAGAEVQGGWFVNELDPRHTP